VWVAAGSESLWLGEGWTIRFIPPPTFPPAKGEEGFVKIYILKERRK
jgi:hypothetical protein